MKLFLEAAISTILTFIISFQISFWVEKYKDSQMFLLITGLIFLLFYSIIFSNYKRIYSWFIKFRRKVFPKIAILNGKIDASSNYTCQKIWANVTPSQWEIQLATLMNKRLSWIIRLFFWLTRQKYVQLINVREISDNFLIIINPFGDNFPEEDCELHLTFSKIRKFMNNGGIFVVTGGAFYMHQNTNVSPSAEQTIMKQHIEAKLIWQSLADTFLYLKFGVCMTSDLDGDRENIVVYQSDDDIKQIGDLLKNTSNPSVKRFRALKIESSCDYVPFLREKGRNNFPIALIHQGAGYLLHIGLYLDSETGLELKLSTEVIFRLFFKDMQIYNK